MASRSSPIAASSRSVIGRTPLSLMSISTAFSHVDCMRSISNCGIFKNAPLVNVFGDEEVFDPEAGEIGDGEPMPGRLDARPAFLRAPRLLGRVLQLAEFFTLSQRIH